MAQASQSPVYTNKISPQSATLICVYIVYGGFGNTEAAEELIGCKR